MKPWAFVATMLGLTTAGGWIALTGEGFERWVGAGAAVLFVAGLGVGGWELRGPRPAGAATPPPLAAVEPRPERPVSIVAPEPLPAERHRDAWFVAETPVDAPLTAAEADFLDALRTGARSLPADRVESHAYRDGADGALIATITLHDQIELLEVALHLADGRLRGDVLPDLLDLPEQPTSLALPAAEGEIRMERVIGWLEQILRRPVQRAEWWHRGRPYAMRYEFADTTEGMLQAFERQVAPRGLHDRLIRSGGAHDGGWVRTAALGEPDAVVTVRAGGRQFETPRLPGLLWYRCPLERRLPP